MGLKRIALAVVCVALIATACSRGDDSSDASSDSTTTTSTGGTAKTADFGDLKDVCQPGDATGATAQGVTDDSIRVATFSDRGFTGRPGLNQELFDSGEVFTKWCNDAGGINGRKLQLDLRDTKLTDYKPRILDSCRDDFFMVGGGAVFDDTGVEDRLNCMLPDIPGFVVTAKARESDLLVQPLPNEPGALELGDLRWIGKEYPDSTQHVGVLTGDIATTAKVAADDREAVENALGWKVVYDDKYPVTGNVGWTAYVQGLKDKGVKGILWTGEPENLAKFETAMKDANYEVDWIRAAPNHYDPSLIATGGDALKNTYVWSSFAPFEEAKDNPATQNYLDIFEKYAPDAKTKALLGLQSWSAWLLFAQAAKECGSDLTRTCVFDNLQKVHEWTGGGLHAVTDPGANKSSGCFYIMKATPKGFVRVKIDTNQGIYNCNRAKNGYVIDGAGTSGLTLADVGKSMKDLK
jgi:ABC-type branched-subunit amino acid transport system substrate-binding protein